MAELAPRSALAGFDPPLTVGAATLAAGADAPMLSIAPFRGKAAAAAEALGVDLPAPGGSAPFDDGSALVWAGLDLWFLRGPGATPGLARRLTGRAAVTDQSDGWVALSLTGADAAEALARLVPIDLSPAAFPAGAAARTELRHMMCLILARDGGFDLLVMRSFAETAAHEIAHAMRAVAARATLG